MWPGCAEALGVMQGGKQLGRVAIVRLHLAICVSVTCVHAATQSGRARLSWPGDSLLGCCRAAAAATAGFVRGLLRLWHASRNFFELPTPLLHAQVVACSPAGAPYVDTLGGQLAKQTVVLRYQVAEHPYAACHYC